ncbi:hypothetical protein [Alkalicoccus chagannorensis]|uniref:hypothetical protein n=1 Tax=Alkalicoccus chagannorensis TaxID=427072 RepID=UPI0004287726|nr:hypothetical protein [Alkalicoccus chagannorensis]
MDVLLWITTAFIVLGFSVILATKKRMQHKVAAVQAEGESEESHTQATSVVRWIWGTTAWGVVSMFLVVWIFQ